MAAMADSFRAKAAEEEVRRFQAIQAGAFPYTTPRGQSTPGSTRIAPTALNPLGVEWGHTINVPWGTTTGPGDPAFDALLAEASQRMVENLVYDPEPLAGGTTGMYRGINLITGEADASRPPDPVGGSALYQEGLRRREQAAKIKEMYG
tara:strand:- start:81 stop:527 length:447 start_codon:yes stop_codon:yes gene_type:complete